MSDPITSAMAKLAEVNRLQNAIGSALPINAQMAISEKIYKNKNAFHDWLSTDEGRMAIRDFAGKFIASA